MARHPPERERYLTVDPPPILVDTILVVTQLTPHRVLVHFIHTSEQCHGHLRPRHLSEHEFRSRWCPVGKHEVIPEEPSRGHNTDIAQVINIQTLARE